MLSRFALLLTLFAVLALPLGMAHATSMPMATGHDAMQGHCDDAPPASPAHPWKDMGSSCTMACASALPAIPAAIATGDPLPYRSGHGRPAPVIALHGLILDIATPPPRIA